MRCKLYGDHLGARARGPRSGTRGVPRGRETRPKHRRPQTPLGGARSVATRPRARIAGGRRGDAQPRRRTGQDVGVGFRPPGRGTRRDVGRRRPRRSGRRGAVNVVLGATTLMYLAKAEELSILDALDGPRLIPAPVHTEVVEIGIEETETYARLLPQ